MVGEERPQHLSSCAFDYWLMLREFFRESGPYLSVIDGRFLPLEDISIDISHEVDTSLRMANGSRIQQAGASTADVSMTTRRDPMMRNHQHITERVLIYNREYEFELSEVERIEYGVGMDFGEPYELEFSALDWEITER